MLTTFCIDAVRGDPYPDLGILIGVPLNNEDELISTRSVDGTLKVRLLDKATNSYKINLSHIVYLTEKTIVENHYKNNRNNFFDLNIPTYTTYTVRYCNIPKYIMLGGNYWQINLEFTREIYDPE